jgi:hypothetical protein
VVGRWEATIINSLKTGGLYNPTAPLFEDSFMPKGFFQAMSDYRAVLGKQKQQRMRSATGGPAYQPPPDEPFQVYGQKPAKPSNARRFGTFSENESEDQRYKRNEMNRAAWDYRGREYEGRVVTPWTPGRLTYVGPPAKDFDDAIGIRADQAAGEVDHETFLERVNDPDNWKGRILGEDEYQQEKARTGQRRSAEDEPGPIISAMNASVFDKPPQMK